MNGATDNATQILEYYDVYISTKTQLPEIDYPNGTHSHDYKYSTVDMIPCDETNSPAFQSDGVYKDFWGSENWHQWLCPEKSFNISG